jgi:ribonuclease HII
MAVTLRVERSLLRQRPPGTLLAAIDEVGRGALAGPVAVGVVVLDVDTPSAPTGVRDSKECDQATRERLAPRVRVWARRSAVGMSSSAEIDAMGIIGALALAASRAINATGVRPDLVLLDGKHDWMSRVAPGAEVVTRVKADTTCAAVAAASIMAKVARDAHMVALAPGHPEYAWDSNKGYAAPEHLAALERHGPSPWHRLSWRLPGVSTGAT